MSIVIQHRESGRRALITTMFISNLPEAVNKSQHIFTAMSNFAYCRSFGQTLKSVVAGRMRIVKECKSLPAAMFGKRKGPFLKLAPAPGWDIVDFFE